MRYRPVTMRRGRWFVEVMPSSLNLPRLSLCCDGDVVNLAATYGNGNSDPVLIVDVDLSGTKLGELIARLRSRQPIFAPWWQAWRRCPARRPADHARCDLTRHHFGRHGARAGFDVTPFDTVKEGTP